jgi:NADH-quinone oxidoreductase subunit J
MPIQLDILLLTAVLAAALWAVMTRSLLRAAIALALTSAVVSVFIFRLGSPLAAVFELSVCSGLISVLFISTISITQSQTKEEKLTHMRERLRRFRFLPLVIVLTGVALSLLVVKFGGPLPGPEVQTDPRAVLWQERSLDMIGQVIILLAGAFGVVILFKERGTK